MELVGCICRQQVITGAVNLGQRELAHSSHPEVAEVSGWGETSRCLKLSPGKRRFSLLKVLEVRMNLSLNLWSFRSEENLFRVSATIPGDRGIKGHGCSFLA